MKYNGTGVCILLGACILLSLNLSKMLCPGNLETASGQIADKSGPLSSVNRHWNSVLLVGRQWPETVC